MDAYVGFSAVWYLTGCLSDKYVLLEKYQLSIAGSNVFDREG
jgi:hypothetical protein